MAGEPILAQAARRKDQGDPAEQSSLAKARTHCSYYNSAKGCKFGSQCKFSHEPLGESEVKDWRSTFKDMQEGASAASLEQQQPHRKSSSLPSKPRAPTPRPAGLHPRAPNKVAAKYNVDLNEDEPEAKIVDKSASPSLEGAATEPALRAREMS